MPSAESCFHDARETHPNPVLAVLKLADVYRPTVPVPAHGANSDKTILHYQSFISFKHLK